jgi:hypothetical protein
VNKNNSNHPMTTNGHNVFGAIICSALLCARASCAFTNEFWVSAMPSWNPTPQGTIGDPYDGSTQTKFDTVMNSMPSNCTIHLLGGTYMTTGNGAFRVKDGQKILGSGIDITVLRLETNAPSHCSVLATVGVTASGTEICDLTCDANAQNGPANAPRFGMGIVGSRGAIRRVKVMNFGGPTGIELMGIGIGQTDNCMADGWVVEDCIVMPPIRGSLCSSIWVATAANASISARLSGNWVYCTNIMSVQAFNVANTFDTLLVGNHVVGSGWLSCGIYSDSGGNTNLTVVNNTFNNVAMGVLLGGEGQVHTRLNFSGNLFEVADVANNWTVGISLGSSVEAKILANTIKPYSTAGSRMRALHASSASAVVAANNVVGSNFDWGLTGASNVILHDNVDLMGDFLATCNQTEMPNSLRRTTVSAASYTAQNSDRYLGIQNAGGATITLPSPALPGKEFIIANEMGSGTVSIFAWPASINGQKSISVSGGYVSKTVISDGTNWFAR